MKKVHLQFNLFLLFAIALMLPACAASDAAHEQILSEQNLLPADVIDDNEYTTHDQSPEENMNQPNDSKPENEKQNSDHQQTTTDNTPSEKTQALEIISQVNEISRESFTEKFGQQYVTGDPVLANAVRIAEVDLNSALFNADQRTGLETLNLKLFDGTHKQIIVTTSLPGSTISLQGKLEESPLSIFFLSVTEQQALATLRLPDINTVYTIKYLHPSGRHYLFQGLITEVERYECEVKIPPAPGSIN